MQNSHLKLISPNCYMFTNQLINQGNYSQIYKGYQTETGAHIAIKHFSPQNLLKLSKDSLKFDYQDYVDKLLKVNSIPHPSIMSYYGYDTDKHNNYYFYLEYCSNRDLASYMKKNLTISHYLVIKLFQQLIQGLQFLRTVGKEGIVHRDIQPGNLLLDENMNLKIGDFQVCKVLEGQMKSRLRGIKIYSPPQAYKQRKAQVSQNFDLWSAGIVLYQMLCQRHPFDSTSTKTYKATQSEIINNIHAYQQGTFKLKYPENLNPSWKKLIQALLICDPDKRPSIKAFCMTFEAWKKKMEQEDNKKSVKEYQESESLLRRTIEISNSKLRESSPFVPFGGSKMKQTPKEEQVIKQQQCYSKLIKFKQYLNFLAYKVYFYTSLIELSENMPSMQKQYRLILLFLSISMAIRLSRQIYKQLTSNRNKLPLHNLPQLHLIYSYQQFFDSNIYYLTQFLTVEITHSEYMHSFFQRYSQGLHPLLLQPLILLRSSTPSLHTFINNHPKLDTFIKSKPGSLYEYESYVEVYRKVIDSQQVLESSKGGDQERKGYLFLRGLGRVGEWFDDKKGEDDFDYYQRKKEWFEGLKGEELERQLEKWG